MKKTIIITIITIFILCSCSFEKASEGIKATDANGNTVFLPKEPKNVAVLFSSFADIWVTAGGEVQITVAESVERGFAREEATLVDGGAGKTIDTESLIAANPDLVICSADIDAQNDAAELCQKVGISAISLKVEDINDYLNALDLFTDLTGRKDLYKKYGEDVYTETEKIRSEYNFEEPPKILFIRAGSSERSTKAKNTEQHFVCEMLTEFGCKNIADTAPILLDGLSIEEIILQDPDFIFISTMGDENAAKDNMNSILEKEEWQNLSAVKGEKVYFLPKDLFQFKPNSRWAEAYEYLAKILSE
ncbi:MAG: ABC transporter substrate-binding protein [Ruminococcaceae bacterium]|nr:ABC transporter substrate-binding protein [Oscillospiraceae bacterium]